MSTEFGTAYLYLPKENILQPSASFIVLPSEHNSFVALPWAGAELAWMSKKQTSLLNDSGEEEAHDRAVAVLAGAGANFNSVMPGSPYFSDREPQLSPSTSDIVGAVNELHWRARRYANGRSSLIVSAFNDATRAIRAAGFPLDHAEKWDGSIWAVPA